MKIELVDNSTVREIWEKTWSGEFIVSRRNIHYPEDVKGYAAYIKGKLRGLITFAIVENSCEVVSVNSFSQKIGIGTTLIDKVVEEAKDLGCTRIWVITTNDNVDAIRFYQKRGFEMTALHKYEIDWVRKKKPGIPRIGNHGIPIKHEIELEMRL